MTMWNPWRGCKKCSEGYLHCYIHKGDAKRGVDTSMIVKTRDFDKPVAQLKKGGYSAQCRQKAVCISFIAHQTQVYHRTAAD